ncbi:hypothetical protein TCAP_00839 [Tolypocladium capitatum]|uniref:Uncharacterized protein n=1 Tax=Tolypocladium capitatum TaxID=45235 RepID=A0A2K3QNY8_9HYPO|nr:hypothetical protein TCAP_00839 [Tolypocladium capitatum]
MSPRPANGTSCSGISTRKRVGFCVFFGCDLSCLAGASASPAPDPLTAVSGPLVLSSLSSPSSAWIRRFLVTGMSLALRDPVSVFQSFVIWRFRRNLSSPGVGGSGSSMAASESSDSSCSCLRTCRTRSIASSSGRFFCLLRLEFDRFIASYMAGTVLKGLSSLADSSFLMI